MVRSRPIVEGMSQNHDHAVHDHQAPHGEQAWDERYRAKPEIWSGNPNAVLVAEATGLQPGMALDAGAGEGGDAFWLAARGWKVTTADISGVAIVWEAIRTWGEATSTPHWFTLVIALASVGLNEGIYRYSMSVARSTGSKAVEVAAWDQRLDVIKRLAEAVHADGAHGEESKQRGF